MSSQPISVRCTWECGFCHKEAETYGTTPVNGGIVPNPPERWETVVLHGNPQHEISLHRGRQEPKTVLLCPPCFQVYWKYAGEMVRFSSDFWWGRVRMIANGEEPREIKLPWADEDRKKDPKNWD